MNPSAPILFSLALLVFSPLVSRADLIWHSPLDGNADTLLGADGVAGGAGSPVSTEDKNGNPDGAVLFNGDSYYDIGTFPALSAGTISAWVRCDDLSTERGAVAVGASGGGTATYFTFMNQNNGTIRVDLDDGALRRAATDPTVQVVTQWYHVATTFADDGTLRLYMDGVEVSTAGLAGDAGPYVMTSSGLIGSERTGARFWIGAIDDVRIYDSELDAAAVTNLFTDGPLYNQDAEDLDGDGVADAFEQIIIDADPGDLIVTIEDVLPGDDFDSDGSTNADEAENTTNPVNPDTDGDGYRDGIETNDGTFDDIDSDTGTNPRDRDTDNDGLDDGVETNDGTFDDAATDTGTHPLVADTDTDTMPDGFEVDHLLDPLTDDGGLDPDNDNSTNVNEFNVGTDPQDEDSDDDLANDGSEDNGGNFISLEMRGTDPLDADTDDDGLIDGVETNDGSFDSAEADTGTNPHSEDTDNDNFRDGAEVNLHGTDPTLGGDAPQPLSVLFIGGNATGNQGADGRAQRFLQDKYGISQVSYEQASAAVETSEDGFDLLVLSSTPGSGDIRGKFEDSLVPIVNWEEAISDSSTDGEFGMATATLLKSTDTTQITLNEHPITVGLPSPLTLFGGTGPETTASDSLFQNITSVGDAADGSITGSSMIFVAEVGDEVDGSVGTPGNMAPARRVMLPWTDATINALTPDGFTLLGNAMDWAVGRIGAISTDKARITKIEYEEVANPPNIIVTLTFTSELNTNYSIETNTDLADPLNTWSNVDDGVEGEDGTTEYVIDFNLNFIDLDPRRFFIVREAE